MAKRYFNGAHANPDWQELESLAAKKERGHGWYTFCKKVRAERGNVCEVCGQPEMTAEEKAALSLKERQHRELHLHHIKKLKNYRHLRFERSNVVVVCIGCHERLEPLPEVEQRALIQKRFETLPEQVQKAQLEKNQPPFPDRLF